MPAPTNTYTSGPAENLRSRAGNSESLSSSTDQQVSRMENSRNHLIPSKFKGKKSTAKRWIDQFNRYAQNKNLSEQAKLNDFFNSLEDSAYDYCSSLSEDIKDNWEELAFRAKYCRVRNQWEAQQQLLDSKQEQGEKLLDYVERLENKGLTDNLDQNVVFTAIMTGMRMDLKPIVAQKNPRSIEELEDFAEQADTVADMQNKNMKVQIVQMAQPLVEQATCNPGHNFDEMTISAAAALKGNGNQARVGFQGDQSRAPRQNPRWPPQGHQQQQNPRWTTQAQQQQQQNPRWPSQRQQQQPNPRWQPQGQQQQQNPRWQHQGQQQQNPRWPTGQEHSGSNFNRRQPSVCDSCGEYHSRNSCQFRYHLCYNCGKEGHIRRICRSAPINQNFVQSE